MVQTEVLGVIPARFQSSRFPGKPLVKILGKSLLQRTYENALRAKALSKILIATDDPSIAVHVEGFGGTAVMTSSDCPCGTDRVYQAVESLGEKPPIVVNIQGDEPCINPKAIDSVVHAIASRPQCPIMSAVTRLRDESLIQSSSVVKCVFASGGKALYFSRSPIPYAQKEKGVYYRHLGLYAFRYEALAEFVRLPKSALQQVEDLEQLKALESGMEIFVTEVEDLGIGVDNPEDIKTVERMLCQENMYL